jgi:ABC-type cobalamin/Fe3+-siderophores transport system ATPase subunit
VISPTGKIRLPSTSFELASGEILYITGRNGSGKSSLLHAIADFNFDHGGEVLLNQRTKKNFSEKEWYSVVHRLGQFNRLQFPIKVSDLLLMAFYRQRTSSGYTTEQVEKAKRVADEFQISNLWDKPAHQLSGGELQLCWLVQIILQQAPVVLLDEPTQYLDVVNRHHFFSYLHRYVQQHAVMVLCVTHDLLFNTEQNYKQLELI